MLYGCILQYVYNTLCDGVVELGVLFDHGRVVFFGGGGYVGLLPGDERDDVGGG